MPSTSPRSSVEADAVDAHGRCVAPTKRTLEIAHRRAACAHAAAPPDGRMAGPDRPCGTRQMARGRSASSAGSIAAQTAPRMGSACGSGSRTADRSGWADRPASGASCARLPDPSTAAPTAARACRDAAGAVDRLDRADLDDLAEIHDQHAVGDVVHDVEVVRDEEIGQLELGLQLLQQVEHLRLAPTCRAPTTASSRITRRGRSASARAMLTRWRWPPDSSCG